MASPTRKAFALRINPELLALVERLAAAELRSCNAQLEQLLREAITGRGLKLPDEHSRKWTPRPVLPGPD